MKKQLLCVAASLALTCAMGTGLAESDRQAQSTQNIPVIESAAEAIKGSRNGMNRSRPGAFGGFRMPGGYGQMPGWGGRQAPNPPSEDGDDQQTQNPWENRQLPDLPGASSDDSSDWSNRQLPDLPGASSDENAQQDQTQDGKRQRPSKPDSGNKDSSTDKPDSSTEDSQSDDSTDKRSERPSRPGKSSKENTDSEGTDLSDAAQPGDGQQPPEKPSDDMTDGQQPPEMPGGQQPGGMGGSGAPTEYAAASTVSGESDGEAYVSEADGENAVLIEGGEASIKNATVEKTGSSSGEDADFYGINAAVLAANGATLDIADTTITTDGAHANGVFSYGEGTVVNVSDTTITTTGSNSGGLMTTGGAELNAENVTVSTSGNSSAAIRSDRGGGTVSVSGGSFETEGVGSPAIYSTADITVTDATLSASNSEAVVIEGGNSVTLNGVTITGDNAKLNGQSTEKTNVLIYQSMSGDAKDGSSEFTMSGGTMTSRTGSMFHVTNVTTTINLTGVTLVPAEDSGTFLSATADSWGTSGKNGGSATVNLTNQTVSGNIVVDEVSSVALNLLDGADYSGAIESTGKVTVTLTDGAAWTLTGDSSIDEFDGDLDQVNLNGYTLYINGVAVEK